jgi:DNA polymerase V
MKKQQIALIDCNNFFVSCERLFRPDLVGRPVLVLSSNDGCVVARSQEVKDMGIAMGVPYFQIKDILQKHGVQIFSGHLALYRDVSRRVFEVLREQVDVMQQYSVDEAFFVIPDDVDAQEVIKQVKVVVEQQVGIPVSIGVGFSKTQAKCAGGIAKRTTGTHVFTSESWDELVVTLPIGSIWGVGGGMSARFGEHGIKTVADLLGVPGQRVGVLFGVVGGRLQAELAGIVCDVVTQKRELQKSLMSTRSFAKTTSDLGILADAVAYHTRHIAADLRAMGAGATTMRVSIRASRHGDFFLRGGSKEVVFTSATNDTMLMVHAAEEALVSLYEPAVPYQKVGVSVVGIHSQNAVPQSLFADATVDNSPLLQAMDAINAAAGSEMITVGSRLQTNTWQAKSGMRSPAYTTRWSDIAQASA